MKRILFFVTLLWVLYIPAFALEVKILPLDPANSHTVEENNTAKQINRRDVFSFLLELPSSVVRNSFEFIDLKFTNIKKDTPDYKLLQKMVYLNYVNNTSGKVSLNAKMNAYAFYKYVENVAGINFLLDTPSTVKKLKKRYANEYDIQKVRTFIAWEQTLDVEFSNPYDNSDISIKKWIFEDVYNTLTTQHFDQENLDHKEMMYSAIEWLAKWTNDKHTVYFPPVKSKSFTDSLTWEFEWIWAYVDMKEPWVVFVISPIPDSPAEKAGIKSGDIILKVWGNTVTEDNSLQEVISWIKWPAGTDIELTIQRGDRELKISVTRQKIVIKEVESEMKWGETYYIKIKNFWSSVSDEFTKALEIIKNNGSIKKIVFDLRNNPGGYLDQVNEMLSNFVPVWEPVSVIKYINKTISNDSDWIQSLEFWNYKLVVLQNAGTASASEIFIGTLKDYFPNTIIVWEKSYWKWSVQTMKGYSDTSILKYTIAKWYTGKTLTWIDGVWIQPDVEVKFDDTLYSETKKDNQLSKALEL